MKITLPLFLFITLFLSSIHSSLSQNQAPLTCGADNVLRGDSTTRKLLAQFNQSYLIHMQNKAALDLSTVYTVPVVVHVYHLGEAVGVGSNVSTASVQAAIDALNQTFRAQGVYSTSQDVKIQFVLASRTPDCQATNGIVRVDARSIAGYQANGCSSGDYATQANLRSLSSWPTGSYVNIRLVHKMPDAAGFTWFLDDLFIPAQYTNGNYATLWGHEMAHSFNLYHTFEGDNGSTQCPVNNNPDSDGDHISDTDPHKQSDNCATYQASSINTCTGLAFGSLLQNFMSYSGCLNRFTLKQVERMRYALQYYRPGLINSFGKTPPVVGEIPPITACAVSAPNGTSPYFGIETFTFNTITVGGGGATSDNGANYADRTCLVQINVQTGIPYSFSLTSLYGNALAAKIYIDYNNNGSFSDANEQVFSSSNYSSSFTGTITIPNGTLTNTKLRMRVMLDPSLTLNACSLPGFSPYGSGMAEDYGLTVPSATTTCTTAVATLSGSQTSNPGQSVSLTADLTGTTPWNLTLNTGQTVTNIITSPYSFTVAPTVSTTYTVAKVSNACGNGTVNGTAVVTIPPPCTAAGATLTGSQTSTPGQSVSLSVALTGTSPWSLTLNTGQVFSNITTSPFVFTIAPTATTTYTISRVSNSCGAGTASGSATITPCTPAVATLTGSQTSTPGQTVSLSIALTGTSPWNLTLNTGQVFTNITTSLLTFTVAPTAATTYTISRVSNACGLGTASGSAAITPCTGALATLTGSQTSTPGQSVSLNVALTGTSPWNLTLNTGQVFSTITTSPFVFTVAPTATTTYAISRVINSCGVGTVNGSAVISPCTAAVATISGSQTSTPGQAVLLIATLTGTSPWNLTLNTGQVFTNITTSPFTFTVAATTATTYAISRVSNSCGAGTANGTATVTPCTAAVATLTGSQTSTPGQTVSLSIALTGSSPWNLTLSTGQTFNNIISSLFTVTVSPSASSTYTLNQVVNACGTGTVSGTAVVTVVIPCTAAVAALTGSQTSTSGQTVSLSISLNGTNPWNLTLNTGQVFSNITASPFSFTVAPTVATTYTIARVSNACGTGTASGSATITPCTAAVATLSGSQTSTPGQTVSLSITLTGTSPWNLTLNTGQVFTNITTSPFAFTVAPTVSTTYVIAKLSNACGNGTVNGTAISTVVVPCPAAGATLSGSQASTPGQTVTLTVSLSGTSPWNLTLNTGQVFTNILTSPFTFTVNPTATTRYTLDRVSNACGTGSTSGAATILISTPCLVASATLTGSQTSTSGQTVSLSIALTGTSPWNLTLNTGQVFSTITTSPFVFTVAPTVSTTYTVSRVSNVCGVGTGNGSAVISLIIPCTTPTSLTESALTTTSVGFNWLLVSGKQYTVQWRLANTTAWASVTGLAGGSYNLTGLAPGTTYQWQVGMNCAGASTNYSAPRTFVTACSPPTLASVSYTSDQTAAIYWQPLLPGTRYQLEYRQQGSLAAPIALTTLATQLLINGLSPATAYEYRIRTLCTDAVSSAFTSYVPFTTLPRCTAMFTTGTGNWTDYTRWSCNRIPTSSDTTEVRHRITIPAYNTAESQRIRYTSGGTVLFETGAKLRLGF